MVVEVDTAPIAISSPAALSIVRTGRNVVVEELEALAIVIPLLLEADVFKVAASIEPVIELLALYEKGNPLISINPVPPLAAEKPNETQQVTWFPIFV